MVELIEKLEKTANVLEEFGKVNKTLMTLEKIAMAKQALNIVENNTKNNVVEKTAAPGEMLRNIGTAAGIGLGLGVAAEGLDVIHKGVKKALFNARKKTLIKKIKESSPELKNSSDKEIEQLLEAGYTIAPDLIQNPVIASSIVNVGHSLGGKLDPNTMKVLADAQNKGGYSNNKTPYSNLVGSGLGVVTRM